MPLEHAIFELAAGLLLVFKPGGHRESMHQHAYDQRLRVLHGGIEVELGRRRIRLTPASRALRIAAGQVHATRATDDTWIVVERR